MYGQTRRFLFGLISVRSWGYRCELNYIQTVLMMSDLPHTLYDFDKKGKRKGSNGQNKPQKIDASDKAFKLQEEANRRAAERRQRQSVETKNEGYTLDDLFNGVADDAPLINGK